MKQACEHNTQDFEYLFMSHFHWKKYWFTNYSMILCKWAIYKAHANRRYYKIVDITAILFHFQIHPKICTHDFTFSCQSCRRKCDPGTQPRSFLLLNLFWSSKFTLTTCAGYVSSIQFVNIWTKTNTSNSCWGLCYTNKLELLIMPF